MMGASGPEMYLDDDYFYTQMIASGDPLRSRIPASWPSLHFSKVHTISMFELIIYQFSFIVGGPVPSSWVANAE